MKNIKKAIVSAISAIAMAPAAVLAQEVETTVLDNPISLNGVDFGTSTQSLQATVTTIIRGFMGLLGLIAVILILYGGFMWMTAAGNEEKVTKAKQIIISGIIGLIIIASAYGIASFVIGSLLPK